MNVVFRLDRRTLDEPAAVHTVVTLGTLLDGPFQVESEEVSVPEGSAVVHVGRPENAPSDCAAILPCDGWPEWNLETLKPSVLREGVLPCPGGDSGSPATERALPGACLRSLGFMLHREEELLDPRRDQWSCFSGFTTRLRDWELLERPIVNEWADQLSLRLGEWADRHHVTRGTVPRWKNGRRFAVALTHDVDWVLRYSRSQAIRLLVQARTPNSYAFRHGLRSLAEAVVHAGDTHDPYCTFDRWIDEESRHGFHSTFFFCPPAPQRRHEYDPTYRLTDVVRFRDRRLSVADLMRGLQAEGAEIGLHGSYESYVDGSDLSRQREQIAQASSLPISGVRQHYLRFDLRRSWAAQEEAGFAYDATLGFNEAIGFRAGVSAPFHPYDPEGRTARHLLELPTTLMDGTLFRTLELDTERAISRIRSHFDAVERAGGLAVLLWHPNATDRSAFPGWWDTYVGALEELAGRDAWVTTAGEIAAWWRDRERNVMGPNRALQSSLRGFV